MKIINLVSPWWRRGALFVLAAVSGTVMLLTASYLYLAPLLPQAAQLQTVDYQIPLRIYSHDGLLIGEFGEKRRTPLSYDQLPPLFVRAVLAAEDERFFRHGGVDMKGLFRAALELLWYQDIRSGGSTITMQVARNFFLDREQKFLRKFNEIVLALEIENILTKEQILELYLNKIYLGHRSYGAEAAAQVYYGKSINQLDLSQLAMIAGLPKAPSAYNPITNPSRALVRRNWILRRMLSLNAISEAQYQEAVTAPVTARYHGPSPDVEAAYLAEMVRREMLSRYDEEQLYTAGLRVFTTLDSALQKQGVAALRNGLHEYDERHGWRGPEGTISLEEQAPEVVAEALEEAVETAEEESDADSTVLVVPTPEQEKDPLTELATRLSAYHEVGNLKPALVIEVGEQSATLLLASEEQVELVWEQMNWARKQIDVEYVGDEPKTAGEILKPGDVVRLRTVSSDTGPVWRLAQIPQVESALVSLDPRNGSIRALVGGYSFSQSHFNRALQGQRQAGSAFKPFIYSAGLLNGLTPASLINDAPVVFEDAQLETAWRPTGAGSKFFGPTRLREALYRSLNLVSIRVLQRTGIPTTLSTLRDFGLPVQRFPRDLSLALGSAAVTPLELATAYCVFANGGYRVEPWFIERIDNNDGKVLWRAPQVILCDEDCQEARAAEQAAAAEQKATLEADAEPAASAPEAPKSEAAAELEAVTPPPVTLTRAVEPRVIWLMDSMMKDVVRRGTAYRAAELGRSDLAGKTGTTNDQYDAWFSGYSPALVTTVWVGFDNPSTLGRGEYGGRAALPIWMEYMGGALKDVPEQQLPQPPGIVTVRINSDTGLQARPGDTDTLFEYFREENLPEQEKGPVQGTGSNDPAPEHLF